MTLFFIIFLAVLVCASAFFSASETALVSLSPHKAKSLALRTPHAMEALHGWLVRPHELLTLILIGNTFVNVLSATLLTVGLVHTMPNHPEILIDIYSWILGTIVIVIVGEMMPKFIARAYPEKTSLFVLPFLSSARRVAAPVINLVIRPLTFLFPRLDAPPVGSMLTLSLEELKLLLEEDNRGVPNLDESVEMVKRALEIHDRRAESIMTPIAKVDFVEIDPPGRPPRNSDFLVDLIVEEGHTRTPVKRDGRMIGFIHCNDLLPYMLTRSTEDLLRLVRPALPVQPDQKVVDLLQIFRKSGVHMGFVVDAQGGVLGVITLEDVLEEITGEILDEYDVHPSTPGAA